MGVDVCSLVTCTTTAPSGAYSYTNLPPSDATGYTVTETQPSGYLNGKTTAGTVTGTNSVAGTATGANSDVIQAIKVYSNGISINNNFGELQAASLNGYVFIDADSNAVRSGTELAGIDGLTVTLTGTDDLGASVNTPFTTVANGASGGGYYNFTNLRPGAYTVTETTPPTGLTHTGAQAGSKGGTIGGSVTAANVGVTGSGNTAISAITIVSNDTAAGYNFGESGQGFVRLCLYRFEQQWNQGCRRAGHYRSQRHPFWNDCGWFRMSVLKSIPTLAPWLPILPAITTSSVCRQATEAVTH